MRLLIHTDGAARGNPGPAGAGAILRDADDGTVLAEIAEPLGRATNNVAEWTAVRWRSRRRGVSAPRTSTCGWTRSSSRARSRGIYRVKHPDLKPIHAARHGAAARASTATPSATSRGS